MTGYRRLAIVVTGATASAVTAVAAPPDTCANWVRKFSAYDLQAGYPSKAYADGIDAHVDIRCVVLTTGALANCSVASEKPAGLGFGAAALALTPEMLMRPATHLGQPMVSYVTIPIAYISNGKRPAGEPSQPIQIAQWALWRHAPSYAQLLAAQPREAPNQTGFVSMRCAFRADTTLRACEALTEEPRGLGFARQAVRLASQFQTFPDAVKHADLNTLSVTVDVHFPGGAGGPEIVRYLAQPDWVRQIDPDKVQAVYPDKAAAAGVHTGSATVDCAVGEDGALKDCNILSETPAGFDFGQRAVAVAQMMQANLWHRDGLPTPGARIKLPIRLVQAPDPAPAEAKSASAAPPSSASSAKP